jgi:endonuclease YncB( thermonuclease family)
MRSLLALILLSIASSACGADFSARVVGISDGDTITVLRDRTGVRVRLHGIDAPETGQDFGSRAKQAAAKKRPTHGYVVIEHGQRHRIENTPDLREWVLLVAEQIRAEKRALWAAGLLRGR